MENHIKNIESIEAYLNKALTESESKTFKARLETDPEFKTFYNEHLSFLEGIKRVQLKAEIMKARQLCVQTKWIKNIGGAFVLIMVVVTAVLILNKTLKPNDERAKESRESLVLDTLKVEGKPVEPSLKVSDTLVIETSPVMKETVKEAVKAPLKIETAKNTVTTKEVLKPLQRTPQSISINTERDTTVICKEGTKLTIKANSFINAQGLPIKGVVDLEVTEFYKLEDMLLANLSTTSKGKLLETGGMLYIEAKKANAKLVLKKNANMEIAFPTQNKKAGMQLFSGEWQDGHINWELQKEQDIIVEDIEVEENIEVPYAVVEQVPVFPGCEEGDRLQQKACTSEAIVKFVRENFNTGIAEEFGLQGRQRINILFKIDKNGSVQSVQSRANHLVLEEEVERVMGLLPKFQPGKQRDKPVTVPYSLPFIFETEGSQIIPERRIRKLNTDSVTVAYIEKRLKDKGNDNLSGRTAISYVMATTQLGWINCDRFVKGSANSIRYRFKVKDGNGRAKVSLLFKSLNAILPGSMVNGSFDFGTVAKNQDVSLVAIKKQNGKLFLDIIETTTVENPDINFNFKEVTVEELRQALRKLNR
ncbi:energy transducer TonB [Snuella sedimenti]|uniref:TonB C-terminal domain-containing protein n=1 Tax=Snuella sedimenti TaxID=2798802 RepID=A0A8J7IH89_9FLAO|nr:energy transducer TonB [Snuella sedimenti]MBJ6368223.1 hypothetical protein [Snuella sedimenti]